MASLLKREIRQEKPFTSAPEEAFLNLQRSAGQLAQQLGHFLRGHGLTPTQYNALRILRGASPGSLPCREVGGHMVTPVPDVTRLLDRLEQQGWVRRRRDRRDRRIVRAAITARGLDLLAGLDSPLAAWLHRRFRKLARQDVDHLIALLERLRGDPD